MLEAVNSVLQSAQVNRAVTDQVSPVDSFAGNPDRVQRTPVLAPYVSPYIHVDVNFDKAVLQIRDGDTGDVVNQFPSETALEYRARQAAKSSQEPVRLEAPGSSNSSESHSASALAFVQESSKANDARDNEAVSNQTAITAQQRAAFAAAAQSGNSNAGSVTLLA